VLGVPLPGPPPHMQQNRADMVAKHQLPPHPPPFQMRQPPPAVVHAAVVGWALPDHQASFLIEFKLNRPKYSITGPPGQDGNNGQDGQPGQAHFPIISSFSLYFFRLPTRTSRPCWRGWSQRTTRITRTARRNSIVLILGHKCGLKLNNISVNRLAKVQPDHLDPLGHQDSPEAMDSQVNPDNLDKSR
jgi:hypothetical protein